MAELWLGGAIMTRSPLWDVIRICGPGGDRRDDRGSPKATGAQSHPIRWGCRKATKGDLGLVRVLSHSVPLGVGWPTRPVGTRFLGA